ncbi:MAG TPA: hypothetical protein V6C88_14620 [Chroococcidiopsis sp.]
MLSGQLLSGPFLGAIAQANLWGDLRGNRLGDRLSSLQIRGRSRSNDICS